MKFVTFYFLHICVKTFPDSESEDCDAELNANIISDLPLSIPTGHSVILLFLQQETNPAWK